MAEAPVHTIICIFGPTKVLPVDKDSAFTGEVSQFILRAINCPLKLLSPFNHGSLRTERQVHTVGKMIAKGEMCPLYTAVAFM